MNLLNKLEKIIYIPTIILMITIVILVVFQIISRYVLTIFLAVPTAWAHEIVMSTFVWWVFLAATIGLRKKRHLGVDSLANLINRKNPNVGKALDVFREIIIMGFLFSLFFLGVRVTLDHMSLKTPILQLPVGLMNYLIFPIFTIIMIFFIVESIFTIVTKKK